MDTPKTSNSTRSLVAKAIDCSAKEFGGGVKTVGELGSPQKFLYWQFPNWRTNNKTIMVPPATNQLSQATQFQKMANMLMKMMSI